MKGKLTNGFEFDIDANVLDNMELIDAMAEAQNDDPTKFSEATLLLLGREERKRLYDHLRDENGRVPVQAVADAFVEIFEILGDQAKN